MPVGVDAIGSGLLRFLGLVAVLFFVVSPFTPLSNAAFDAFAARPQLQSADAIVVLGGSLTSSGELRENSLRRTLHGLQLYHAGFAPVLVFSGQHEEGEARLRLARSLGVDLRAIVIAPDADTTREEALFGGPFLLSRGIKRVLLVSDSHHLVRARAVFSRVGVEALAAPADLVPGDTGKPRERMELMLWVLTELAARTYYWLRGYV